MNDRQFLDPARRLERGVPMVPIRVLFVCATNSAMSAMAEGFLRRFGGESFAVESAGVEPQPLHPMTLEVMQRAGVDMTGHRPRPIVEAAGPYDFVVTVCEKARSAVHAIPGDHRLIHWRFADPLEAGGAPRELRKVFLRARDEVAGRVRLFAYAQTRHQGARARRRLAPTHAVA
jgi:arsenate reductase